MQADGFAPAPGGWPGAAFHPCNGRTPWPRERSHHGAAARTGPEERPRRLRPLEGGGRLMEYASGPRGARADAEVPGPPHRAKDRGDRLKRVTRNELATFRDHVELALKHDQLIHILSATDVNQLLLDHLFAVRAATPAAFPTAPSPSAAPARSHPPRPRHGSAPGARPMCRFPPPDGASPTPGAAARAARPTTSAYW